jgi:hypothetical protein
MGFLHQLQLLLWKNVTLKRRSPVSDPRPPPVRRLARSRRPRARECQRCVPRAHVRRPGARRPRAAAAGDPSPGPLPLRAQWHRLLTLAAPG